jgi:hypothetical protein
MCNHQLGADTPPLGTFWHPVRGVGVNVKLWQLSSPLLRICCLNCAALHVRSAWQVQGCARWPLGINLHLGCADCAAGTLDRLLCGVLLRVSPAWSKTIKFYKFQLLRCAGMSACTSAASPSCRLAPSKPTQPTQTAVF